MELKPGYKRTEVGTIPEEWDVRYLDTLGSGAVPAIKAGPFGSALTKDTYVRTGFKVYGQEQVISGNHLFGDYFISPAKYKALESCAVKPGDILLSLVGTAGKLLVVPNGAPEGIINPRLIRFSFDRKIVFSAFFRYLFESSEIQDLLARYAQGGTMGVLNASMLRIVQIPIPSLPEQQAITTALSNIDALISSLDQLIAKKRDIKQATMQQLLTGRQRLPGFSGDWKVRRLKDLGTTYGGLVGKTKDNFGHGAAHYVPFLNVMTNVVIDCEDIDKVELRVGESQNRVLKGDLLFNGSSETPEEVAMCALVEHDIENLYLNSFCFGFRLKSDALAHGLFLAYYMRGPIGRELVKSLAQGSTRYNLSKVALLNGALRLPEKKEQTAIASVLSDMDTEITALEQKRDKARAIKQGMMQELLTGRIRLV